MASAKVVEHFMEDVVMQQVTMERNANKSDPPFEETYKNLFLKHNITPLKTTTTSTTIEERDLPLIDLGRLVAATGKEREKCKREIAEASMEWGFFQVVNHGISCHILDEMTKEQVKVFREPFNKKKGDNCMNLRLSHGSYRWGSPSATCLSQLSWSEAFHIPLTDICHTAPRNIGIGNSRVSNLWVGSRLCKVLGVDPSTTCHFSIMLSHYCPGKNDTSRLIVSTSVPYIVSCLPYQPWSSDMACGRARLCCAMLRVCPT